VIGLKKWLIGVVGGEKWQKVADFEVKKTVIISIFY
jgi:hypothetical protein